jgi:hypothetical protein
MPKNRQDSLRIRKPLVVLAILVLASGLSLFAIATFRETRTSTSISGSAGGVSSQYFQYSGETLSPDNPPQVIVGTTGIADLIILKTPWRDFNDWICHQPQVSQLLPGGTSDCAHFWGGDINVTILYSYLQTHQSQIAYSQTIANQNVTLDYPVSKTTDVTIVLAPIGSGIVRYYFQQTRTNQTLTYPLIGYSERPGTIWNLTSISLGLVSAGTAGLLGVLIQFRAHSERRTKMDDELAMQKCSMCGHESLFFAEKCNHCGTILSKVNQRLEVASHTN